MFAGGFSEGLAGYFYPDRRDRGVGYIDRTGSIAIGPRHNWTFAGDFCGGLAKVMTPDGMGFINSSGQSAIAPAFHNACEFSEGLAAVAVRPRKWGYIDATGNFIITPAFSSANKFRDGLAQVRVCGKWGYIDRQGTNVHHPSR